MSTKVNGETRERPGQSAKRSAAIRGQAGRGATVAWQTSAGCGRPESRDFLPARFCGRSRADLFRASRFFLHLRDPREREESTENFQANGFEECRQVLAEGVGVLDHFEVVVLLL